jgi:DmsE family decaheme c-type cytochrome
MHVLRILKRLEIGLAMMALVLLFSVGAAADEKKDQAKSAQPAAGEAAGQYVGSQTCQGCHDQIFKNFQASPHWITTEKTKVTPGAHGCESCHGPGSAHVEGGGDKTKIFTFKGVSSEQITQRCLTCHQNSQEHGNWARGMHATNGVSCIDCHSPHHAKTEQALLVDKTPQLCYRCHNPVKAEFSRPYRHRVNEGLVQCTDCHNVHGAYRLAHSLRSTPEQNQICFRCHTDKQGPFAFEHEPVKTGGCTACHTPHGSVNARLLKTSQVNILCLQCHTASFTQTAKDATVFPKAPQANPVPNPTGPVHNQALRYQACTLCHPAIHGSNASSAFLK